MFTFLSSCQDVWFQGKWDSNKLNFGNAKRKIKKTVGAGDIAQW